ncbi:MAG: helix-turn-helix transcriptional regulator [Erythrobacter sp.]|nr:helix-turn-helix transcriptional regulator [Erythrobacter sp.]
MQKQAEQIDFDAMLVWRERADAALDALTDRQTEVLEHAAEGKKNELIAHEIGLTTNSVEKHLRKAKRALGASTRDQAIKKFIVLRTITGTRNSGFLPLDVTENLVEQTLQALPVMVAQQLRSSPEFEQFLDDLRSSGPRAWDAKFGRGWRAWAIPVGAAFMIILAGSAIGLANALDTMVAN